MRVSVRGWLDAEIEVEPDQDLWCAVPLPAFQGVRLWFSDVPLDPGGASAADIGAADGAVLEAEHDGLELHFSTETRLSWPDELLPATPYRLVHPLGRPGPTVVRVVSLSGPAPTVAGREWTFGGTGEFRVRVVTAAPSTTDGAAVTELVGRVRALPLECTILETVGLSRLLNVYGDTYPQSVRGLSASALATVTLDPPLAPGFELDGTHRIVPTESVGCRVVPHALRYSDAACCNWVCFGYTVRHTVTVAGPDETLTGPQTIMWPGCWDPIGCCGCR